METKGHIIKKKQQMKDWQEQTILKKKLRLLKRKKELG